MRCFLFLCSLCVTPFLTGCILAPLYGDYDENAADNGMKKLEEQRMERMRQNPAINPAEYEALSRQSGASGLPPKPSIADLEKQIEAARKKSK